MEVSWWLALLAGVALAAACGLRAFLPLLVLGVAARLGLLALHGSSSWLAGDLALVALGVATVLEILGDKIPVVDHALDAVGTVVRPVAAWIGAYALLSAWPTPWGQLAAVVLGTSALVVHGLKAKVRLGSTAVTLGSANPLLSLVEDALSLLGAVCAVLAPIAVVFALVPLVWFLTRRRARRGGDPLRGRNAAAPLSPIR